MTILLKEQIHSVFINLLKYVKVIFKICSHLSYYRHSRQ